METALYPILLLAVGLLLYVIGFQKLGNSGYGRSTEGTGYLIGGLGIAALCLFEYYLFQNNSAYTNILAIVGIILAIALGVLRMIYLDLIDIAVGRPLTPEQQPLVWVYVIVLLGGGIVALVV